MLSVVPRTVAKVKHFQGPVYLERALTIDDPRVSADADQADLKAQRWQWFWNSSPHGNGLKRWLAGFERLSNLVYGPTMAKVL